MLINNSFWLFLLVGKTPSEGISLTIPLWHGVIACKGTNKKMSMLKNMEKMTTFYRYSCIMTRFFIGFYYFCTQLI